MLNNRKKKNSFCNLKWCETWCQCYVAVSFSDRNSGRIGKKHEFVEPVTFRMSFLTGSLNLTHHSPKHWKNWAKFSIGLSIDNSAKQNQTKIVFSDVSDTTAVLSSKKYVWIWSINFFKGCSLCYCDAISRRAILFAHSMNHIPSYLSVTSGRRWGQKQRKMRLSFGSNSPYVV